MRITEYTMTPEELLEKLGIKGHLRYIGYAEVAHKVCFSVRELVQK